MSAAASLQPMQFPEDEMRAIGEQFEKATGHCANCYGVSAAIGKQLGFEVVEGTYRGPEVNHRADHAWNMHGRYLIDATARQWDPEGDRLRIIPPGDPRRKWYRIDTERI